MILVFEFVYQICQVLLSVRNSELYIFGKLIISENRLFRRMDGFEKSTTSEHVFFCKSTISENRQVRTIKNFGESTISGNHLLHDFSNCSLNVSEILIFLSALVSTIKSSFMCFGNFLTISCFLKNLRISATVSSSDELDGDWSVVSLADTFETSKLKGSIFFQSGLSC